MTNNILSCKIDASNYPKSVSRNINTFGNNEYGNSLFTGAIDDFRLYNRILLPNEISNIMNNITILLTNVLNPLTISGCCLWMDAADANTIILNSNSVSKWVDKSPNTFIFSQSTTGNQPLYSTNTLNGNSTLTFTAASSQYLGGPTNFAVGTNSYAIFLVFKFNDTSYGSVFAKSLFGGATGRIFVLRDNDGLQLLVTDNVHSNQFFPDTYSANTYRVLCLVYNRTTGTSNVYQNGILINSYTYATPDSITNLTNTFNL